MEKEIRGVDVTEMAKLTGLDEQLIKRYIENELKEDIAEEKLVLADGKYHPFVLELLLIQRELDLGAEQLLRRIDSHPRKMKAG